jgi:zinc-ribbon domain
MFCSACGHNNAAGSMSCSKCGSPLAMVVAPAGRGQVGAAAAPATATATPGANPSALATGSTLAGLGDRAIAALLDIVVAASPFAVIGMWACAGAGLRQMDFSCKEHPQQSPSRSS